MDVRKPTVFLGSALFLFAGPSLPGTVCHAGTFTYDSFYAATGLIVKAHAAPFEGHLRLTPAIGGLGLGGAWLETKQPVDDGFQTTFQIQITDKHSSGADGFAFVIQGGPEPVLGQTGQGLGYGGITNQFVVHFDNYHWGDHPTAGKYDEIAVVAASSPTRPVYNVADNIIASASRQIVYSDGAVHTISVRYAPGNLQVYLDDMANPVMTAYVNLARLMDLDHGRAWVGFTAATGADWQNQDLVSWSFASGSDASHQSQPTALSNSGGGASVNPSTPLFSAPTVPPPVTTPLARDPTFGYQVPPGIDLSFRIEASTDLVHWTLLTNATLYFRDADSTNYNSRFYRFVPK